MLLVGNDIVDLTVPACKGKSKNARFVNRVFHADEKKAILQSKNPDQTLWMMWAAKETAYKIFSKLHSPPVFSHKKFFIHIEDLPNLLADDFSANGEVIYEGQTVILNFLVDPEKIHATGLNRRDCEYFQQSNLKKLEKSPEVEWWNNKSLKTFFSEWEKKSIKNSLSAWVRYYCKLEIAGVLKIKPARLQIIRELTSKKSQPPFLLIDDHRVNIDLSLSHHGSWIAWVFCCQKSEFLC